jgi:hypothetical protein
MACFFAAVQGFLLEVGYVLRLHQNAIKEAAESSNHDTAAFLLLHYVPEFILL